MSSPAVVFVEPRQLGTCKNCGQQICWQQSRYGRPYPTNVLTMQGKLVAGRADFHKCSQADKDAFQKRTLEAAGQQTMAPSLDMSGVNKLFDTAIANGLKYPKIRLQTSTGQPVALSRAGKYSKHKGQIMVTDGERFGVNKYFGRVTETGVWVPSQLPQPEVRVLLEKLSTNPAETAAQYGKLTGNCCFCLRPLFGEDGRSTAVGYGPICAEKFGLPW